MYNKLGEIIKNNEYGVYGKYSVNVDNYVSLEVGKKEDGGIAY